MKRHVNLVESIKPVSKVRVVLEGKVAKIYKGKVLKEEVTFEEGDDLATLVPELVEEYEESDEDVLPTLDGDDELEGLEDNEDEDEEAEIIDLDVEDPVESQLQEGSGSKFGKK